MTRSNRRHVVGVVVSDRMNKSVVVETTRLVQHPLYKKYLRRRSKLMAHDEENTARIGDHVELVETRPLSKRKSWRLLQVLRRAPVITRVAALEPTVEVPEDDRTEAVPGEVEPVSGEDETAAAGTTGDEPRPTPEEPETDTTGGEVQS